MAPHENAGPGLEAALASWSPEDRQQARRVDPWPAVAFAALLDTAPPPLADGDALPPLWHWFTLLEHPATAELGADGHPAAGPFLPPIPDRRRMFAGGRLQLDGPIRVGAQLAVHESVAEVRVTSGRSGEIALVTVRRELTADGAAVGREEQDLVYRSGPGAAPADRPAPSTDAPATTAGITLATDPVLLARFSALTYNGHRIHYDRPYATEVEGYPDLVVHGPLLALLALEVPRRRAAHRTVAHLEYRLVRPAFLPATVVAEGTPTDDHDGVELTVAVRGAAPSLVGRARFTQDT